MPRPLNYQDIAEMLEARIRSGEFKPGEKLPTYLQLAEQFGVGYTTMAKAIAILRDRGLLVGAPPKGTFVADVIL